MLLQTPRSSLAIKGSSTASVDGIIDGLLLLVAAFTSNEASDAFVCDSSDARILFPVRRSDDAAVISVVASNPTFRTPPQLFSRLRPSTASLMVCSRSSNFSP